MHAARHDAGDNRRLTIAAGIYTVWMLIWTPVILWSYGPQNFLWLCNLAQFIILYALWTGHRLLLSSQVGTVLLVGVFWTPDFLLGLVSGGAWAVATAYMFNPERPLPARLMSLYHIVLPLFLLWVIHHVGYDRRGPWLQSGLAVAVLPLTWLLTEPERNINWLHQPLGVEQTLFPTPAFVVVMMVLFPVLLFFPGHYLALWARRRLPAPRRAVGAPE